MEDDDVGEFNELKKQLEILQYAGKSIKSVVKSLDTDVIRNMDERIPKILTILDEVIDNNETTMKELRNTNPSELKVVAIYSTNNFNKWLFQYADQIDPAKYEHSGVFYLYGSVPIVVRYTGKELADNEYIVSIGDKEKINNKLRELGQKFTSRSIVPRKQEYKFFRDFADMPHRMC